ncbi:glycosyltransferase family 2 protein [Magnetospirillum sp. SS-4]|uniref:glycosyltransferase family 2 protein n=1 Tax=Magnetospirillum sp. SS-4 TaxID=2681465 RepID=UPI001381DEF5|nr:glycosyltransferase family 2 protein [Magnetospirillum sp. SS-4]CAA7621342.1 Family 2 glycosyl transferase [Magnetospirillum sp. SS-4]
MISVVIPAYNEEGAVAETVAQVREILATNGFQDFEIIVVDDGSADRTAEVAANAGARVIRKPQNIGYGHSLKVGIAAATHDTVVITDADGTYPIDQIPALVERYRQGFDMVVGARTGAHYRESWLKSPLRAILTWLVEFACGRTVPDVNSGLRVFSRDSITPFFTHLCDTFSFTTSITLAYILRRKYVEYIPVPYHKRIGTTKVRLFRDSLRTMQYIVQAIVFYNPLKLFLLLSMILTLGALLALGGSLAGLAGGAMLAGQALIAAVVVFGLGLLAEMLRQIDLNQN